MDLALHRGRWLWHVEKWYVDALLPTGDVLIVLLAGLRICGYWRGRVTAELYPAEGDPVRGDAPAPWRSITGADDRLTFGTASIDGTHLVFDTPGLSGTLDLVPRVAPVMPRTPLFAVGGTSLGWSVEIPDADVTGVLRWPGGTLDLAGARGYRDRVWTDILPWRLPMRVVRWGRAAAGPHAMTWMRAATVQGEVHTGWVDGIVPDPAPDAPPLTEQRTLFSTAVAEMPALHLGALGRFLKRRVNPHQTRFAARTVLDGARGMAVHEEVLWR